jgi:uncharacterized membrane protein
MPAAPSTESDKMLQMAETHSRSLLKAISWRLTGSLDTLVISFLITRKFTWAFTITGIEFFSKIILFYAHERFWNKIPIGRVVTTTSQT